MALVPEDGTGVQGADTYASLAYISAYWTNRPHDPLAATWAAATTANQEGAARETTSFVDAQWGPFYRGVRRGWVQGLLWPRTEAFDDVEVLEKFGYELPDMPSCLQDAVAELSPRALSSRLAPDLIRGGMVKMRKAGPVQIEYFDGAPALPTYGSVALLLSPILNGQQPMAPNGNWSFA